MNLTLQDKRNALYEELQKAAQVAAEEGGFKDPEGVKAKWAELQSLDEQLEKLRQGDQLLSQIRGLKGTPVEEKESEEEVHSLGDFFVKSCGAQLPQIKNGRGRTISSPEFKASGDAHKNPAGLADLTTEFTHRIVGYRQRLTVADLFSQGTVSGNAIAWLQEGALEGDFQFVAEGAKKPTFHFSDPELKTETLKKIAGIMKFSDEMLEDFGFLVTEINNRGLYQLMLAEEKALLSGDGAGAGIQGILNRPGIQSLTKGGDTAADAIFKAMNKVSLVTNLTADGVVINPADYEGIRLAKDGNSQYYGGGYFNGAYGTDGVVAYPPIWGLPTVVTPSIPAGTALVGAFKAGATLYRKGGVRVEMTNSNQDEFESNIVTTRIEERLLLAPTFVSAFAKLDLNG